MLIKEEVVLVAKAMNTFSTAASTSTKHVLSCPFSCVCQIEGSGLDIVASVITVLLRADLQVKSNR